MSDDPKTYDESGQEVATPQPIALRDGGGALARDNIRSIGVEEAVKAINDYRALQDAFDKAMPKSRMNIQGKEFRKKEYWRAVKRAFNVGLASVGDYMIVQYEDGSAATLPLQSDGMVSLPAGTAPVKDFTVRSVVRATHSSGASQDGIGYCSRSEKLVYQKEWVSNKKRPVLDGDGFPVVDEVATLDNATLHNIGCHAYTRATNRAISDLVGFGEVSAEEIHPRAQRDKSNGAGGAEPRKEPATTQRRAPSPAPAKKLGPDNPPDFVPGQPIRGTCAGVQPETAWKPSKLARGTKDKSFKLDAFPGVLFRTNSNPADLKRPWGKGAALTCEAGATYPRGEEDNPDAVASLDCWYYEKTGDWYVRVHHVRPASGPEPAPKSPESDAAAPAEAPKASDTYTVAELNAMDENALVKACVAAGKAAGGKAYLDACQATFGTDDESGAVKGPLTCHDPAKLVEFYSLVTTPEGAPF